MFEYTTVAGYRVNINPKYITCISDNDCKADECCIYTVDGYWFVKESYDTVNKHYGNWLARCG